VKAKNFDMKRPCANCPFQREGAIELRPGRVQGILENLLEDDRNCFVCHKTVGSKDPSACMGALSVQWKAGRIPITARLALSLGMITIADLEKSGEVSLTPAEILQSIATKP
jgi:hypothetical protein